MSPSDLFNSSGDFAIAGDTSKPPASSVDYLPIPGFHDRQRRPQIQHQQYQNQLSYHEYIPLLSAHISSQQSVELQDLLQPYTAFSSDPMPPSYFPYQQNVANYEPVSALYHTLEVQLPVTCADFGLNFAETGVKLSHTTMGGFSETPAIFTNAETDCEAQLFSNTSSTSIRDAASHGYGADSTYVASPLLTSSVTAHRVNTATPACLPMYAEPMMSHSLVDTGNHLGNQPIKAIDDESNDSTALPISYMTSVPACDSLQDCGEDFCSPTDTSAHDSPSPFTDTGSPGHKRKQSPQAGDCSDHKRRMAKTPSGKGVRNEKFKAATGHKGKPGLLADQVFECANCTSKPFASLKELERHENKKHGRYPCILNFPAFSPCEKRFSKKNEWKRHCITQHIVEGYYVCSSRDCQGKPNAVFLRKDLFREHLKRIHTPEHIKIEHKERQAKDKSRREDLARSKLKAKRKSAAGHNEADGDDDDESPLEIPFPNIPYSQGYEASCQEHQELTKNGARSRVKLPSSIACQFKGCGKVFEGETALNKYLEHVAKYLDGVDASAYDFQFGHALVPYFKGIGILKAKEGTSESNFAWELVSATPELEVSPEYLPDHPSDVF